MLLGLYVRRLMRKMMVGTHIIPLEGDKNMEWLDGGDASENEDGDSKLSDEWKIFCLVVDSCVLC